MADDLFREEALKAQSGERWGRPVGLLPMAWSRITLLLLTLTIALVAFLATASFSRKETVRGRLRPTAAEARVFASEAGAVKQLRVGLGESVEMGQILLEIGTDRMVENDVSVSESSLAALRQERQSLGERQSGLKRVSAIQRQQTDLELQRTLQGRDDTTAALDLAIEQLVITEERRASLTPLMEKGLTTRERVRQSDQEILRAKQEIINLKSSIEQADIEISELRLKRSSIDEELSREMAGTRERLAQIDAQLVSTQSQSGYVVTAPITGRIAALQAAVGDRVDPTQPVMAIVPEGEKLLAELFAPSRAIAFIEPGQNVRLQYDALPYQKFGAAQGVVQAVSSTTLSPYEVRGFLATEEPVYRILIDLEAQSMQAFGKDIPLQSGMELSADIILEKRRLIEWLMEPLLAASSRMQK
ncbi:MAG: hypothetical protein CME88_18000 [Hirschia sp.]|nr:hypothetical protein [Hirschia sp.]MBF20057.1 hypothetical protein [Hirschia sp.]MBF20264.1 hypothetical protein [Hirschia sp.]